MKSYTNKIHHATALLAATISIMNLVIIFEKITGSLTESQDSMLIGTFEYVHDWKLDCDGFFDYMRSSDDYRHL